MIERAVSEPALARISNLLAANSLPVDDLGEGKVDLFCRCASNEVLGAVGIEVYGAIGLIRSLVVADAGRGKGLGSDLVQDLETEARLRGVKELYLLTMTAEDFFAARGYSAIERNGVPSEIRSTRQFSSLCRDSAIVMVKDLTGGSSPR